MSTETTPAHKTCCCKVDSDGAVNLNDILNSFKAPIKEEHTWAICYQCIRFFIDTSTNNASYYLVRTMDDVYLRTDGNVHPKTTHPQDSIEIKRRHKVTNELEVIIGLGTVLYSTLDHCYNEEEERIISEPLEELMGDMISNQVNRTGRSIHELVTDDEGIERDSEDTDMASLRKDTQLTLKDVLQRCEAHVSILTQAQAECHYKAVVRALVTEALELSMFLDIVAKGIHLAGTELYKCTTKCDLDQLQFMDWSSLWLTVIAELRMGVKLKKVNYGRAPIEYELTPYEILMKDIRNCKQNLRKVKPENVRRHARDIILDFIRSRPTLKKVSDRKLAPRPPKFYSPREQLMHSIRKAKPLCKTQQQLPFQSPSKSQLVVPMTDGSASALRRNTAETETGETPPKNQRLISIDYSQLDGDDDDFDDEDEDEDVEEETNLWTDELMLGNDDGKMIVDKYDLAMASASYGPTFRFKIRPIENGALNLLADPPMGSHSVPHSRPDSRQSLGTTGCDDTSTSTGPLDQLSLDNRLSLTLEEIVHIRTVLTKAEIEALPVEAQVRANVENRKVCFLCLKTTFSVFGPWGHKCILCQCTVCSKCCGRMRLPMEHFATVPVVLLSPNIMATPDNDSLSDDFFPSSSGNSHSHSGRSTPDGAGAASASSFVSNKSPSRSRPSSSLDRFRAKNAGGANSTGVVDRLRADTSGQTMIVCHDCRAMVLQIIKSAQANRSAIRNKHLQSLTLDLSPMF